MVERLEIPSLTSGRDNTFFDVRFYRGLWWESDEEKIYCPLTAKRSLCPRSEQQRARKPRQKDLNPISQDKPFSRQSCRRISTGNLSRLFHLQRVLPLS